MTTLLSWCATGLGPVALWCLWTRHELAGAALVCCQLVCFVAWVACCARAVGRR